MYKIVVFGGTGGLGSKLSALLKEKYEVISLGSEDVDVKNYTEVENFFDINKVDVVINASGINYDGFIHRYDETNQHKIDEQIDVNIKGNLNILSNCLKYMRNNKFGRVILFSSVLSNSPVVGTGVYSGCKGFIDTLVKSVSVENLSKGITCNSLQIGYFDGGLTHRIPEKFREILLDSIPMKRWGKIDELCNVIDMLINTEYITGTNIKINGGLDV